MKNCPSCKKKFEDRSNFCPHDGEVLEYDLSSLVGQTLDGQYQVEALLGQGGMGAVYRARHILLGDCVAIKVMSSHLRNNPEFLRRFRREAQAARRFHHPNAVAVYDLRNTSDGMIYMVLEYVNGRTLRAELRDRFRFTPAEALELLEPVAEALNAAHALGVVHRDLKPDNIMIGKSPDGKREVKLMDLGLAKINPIENNPGSTELTLSGQILGTPFYMSPEQWGADSGDGGPDIDGRADIYSLGVVFYELLAGKRPFDMLSTQELARAHTLVEPHPLHEFLPDVPADFSRVVLRAMSKKRSLRQTTCAELIEQLQASLTPSAGAESRAVEVKLIGSAESFVLASQSPTVNKAIQPSMDDSTMKIEIVKSLEASVQASSSPASEFAVFEFGASGLNLQNYEFEIAVLDDNGRIVERRIGRAQAFAEDLRFGAAMEMVFIPGGEFLMGSSENEESRDKAEGPQHMVKISQFLIGKFPVTQAQWRSAAVLPQIMRPLNPNPSRFKGDDLPVECVSWEDCREFCSRLSFYTGRSYTLPSEAQWEYACRAGTSSPFHFGNSIIPDLSNFDGNHPYGKAPQGVYRAATSPVGSLGGANAFGLYDMHGNVWEWCADIWHGTYKGSPADGKAWTSGGNSALRALRGGSWYSRANACRSALRYAEQPDSREDTIGFRAAVSLNRNG